MPVIILSSILIGLIFAPLGCLVLWKRYVYFGDGLAHATMLAGIISVMIGLPLFLSGIITTLLFAFAVFKLKRDSGNNAAIGITSSLMISLSLIISYALPGKFSITALLFGDIVSAGSADLVTLTFLLFLVTGFLSLTYRQLFLSVLSSDIAMTRGVKVQLLEFTFLAILSLAVLSTIKIVGALLVTSIILIPAMTARIVATSPLRMIGYSVIFAVLMNCIGILISLYVDIPFAPVIIVSGGIIYFSLLLVKRTIAR
jgi:zinc transport system permease protein